MLILKILSLYFLLLVCLTGFGQKNIFGEYESSNHLLQIELKPDLTYTSIHIPWCGTSSKPRYDTGKYTILNDTIFIFSNKEVLNEYSKFYFVEWLDSNLNCLTEYFLKDKQKIGLENTLFTTLIKSSIYIGDKLEMRATIIDEKRLVKTYYFPNGQVKRIETYKKGKKKGVWYYYNREGRLEKIESY